MRFVNFLNERLATASFEDTLRWIKRDCKPWLREVKKAPKKHRIIWRGWSGGREIGIFKVRKDRRPLDTSLAMHRVLDIIFNEMFGWKARSEAMFATPDFKRSLGYGESVGIVFPTGKFKYIWSPKVKDLTVKMTSDGSIDQGRDYGNNIEEYKEKWMSEIKGKIKSLDYTNKGLQQALTSKSEIMINCDYYYGISDQTMMLEKYGKYRPISPILDEISEWIWDKLNEI